MHLVEKELLLAEMKLEQVGVDREVVPAVGEAVGLAVGIESAIPEVDKAGSAQ